MWTVLEELWETPKPSASNRWNFSMAKSARQRVRSSFCTPGSLEKNQCHTASKRPQPTEREHFESCPQDTNGYNDLKLYSALRLGHEVKFGPHGSS